VLYSAWSGDPAVICPAAPGAGKTRLVALLAASLADRAGLRVGVAAQTREQAAEIANRLGRLTDSAQLLWGRKGSPPPVQSVRVVGGVGARFPATGGGVIVATTARWIYADHDSLGCDVMLVDEAWQATYADLGCLGAFAAQVVCVGDPGQIAPVVTGSTTRWEGSATAPHLPAPTALLAAHKDAVTVVRLTNTWRLGPQTTALVQPAFYPDLPFTSRRPPEHITDRDGRVLPEITARPLPVRGGPSDPVLVSECATSARALIGTQLTTAEGTRDLTDRDVMVVCPHVSQAAAVRALLADLPGVMVGTANAVQGMERPASVVLHPLAGYRDPAGFGLDPGRACVMLSRHRAHALVVTDRATGAVLNHAEPSESIRIHQHVWASFYPDESSWDTT